MTNSVLITIIVLFLALAFVVLAGLIAWDALAERRALDGDEAWPDELRDIVDADDGGGR